MSEDLTLFTDSDNENVETFSNLLIILNIMFVHTSSSEKSISNCSYATKKAMQIPGFIPVPGHERTMISSVFCEHHSMVIDTKPWDLWFGADVILEVSRSKVIFTITINII